MPIELVVYRLNSVVTEVADHWLKELEEYLTRTLNGNIVVTRREDERPADALWIGAPFIIVGEQEEAKRFISQLSTEARQILEDCAYYWILSDTDQYLLSPERTIVLSWAHKHFEIIASRLKLLLKYPRLAGLSQGLHKIRMDIDRITVGRQGPWSSVLILGESGAGKEEVAKSLYESLDFSLYEEEEANKEGEEVINKKGDEKGDSALQAAITEILQAIHETFPTLKQSKFSPGTDKLQRYISESKKNWSKNNRKNPEKFTALSCKTFSADLIGSQLFGIGNAATGVPPREGLLVNNSDGCVFLDDFDTALNLIQGPLLRVMATKENEPAAFYRVGEEGEKNKEKKTWVWLIFSTNADIVSLVDDKKLREDFIFRFKDRIIHIPPLRERPADIPAIALRIWDSLWKSDDPRKRALTPPVLQHLLAREKNWDGNVRALQTLLSLTTSMAKLPTHDYHSLRVILDEIMSRGAGYKSWVGIITSPSFTAPVLLGSPLIREIRELNDEEIIVDAKSRLTPEGQIIFNKALSGAKKERGGKVVSQRIRLARIVSYVARQKAIRKENWSDLCRKPDVPTNSNLGEGTFLSDIKLLAAADPAREKKLLRKGDKEGKMDIYEPVPEMFN
jgi:DNA-binding NtrC family response regulator